MTGASGRDGVGDEKGELNILGVRLKDMNKNLEEGLECRGRGWGRVEGVGNDAGEEGKGEYGR